ncbi:hypothetical protein ACQJ0K_25175 [Priestia megaterium]|uniref:hypothetical protein n=1 Tax=Priestia megaterium TaxID=1404 RepID=UPI003CF360B5
MEKVEIANELLKNSENDYIRALIKNYLLNFEELEQGKCENEMLIRFHNCVSYINKVDFNITGWMLNEIPTFYAHCFWNKKTNEAFDLGVWAIGEVIPRYLDSQANEQDSKNIEEAIKKFIVPSLTR